MSPPVYKLAICQFFRHVCVGVLRVADPEAVAAGNNGALHSAYSDTIINGPTSEQVETSARQLIRSVHGAEARGLTLEVVAKETP